MSVEIFSIVTIIVTIILLVGVGGAILLGPKISKGPVLESSPVPKESSLLKSEIQFCLPENHFGGLQKHIESHVSFQSHDGWNGSFSPRICETLTINKIEYTLYDLVYWLSSEYYSGIQVNRVVVIAKGEDKIWIPFSKQVYKDYNTMSAGSGTCPKVILKQDDQKSISVVLVNERYDDSDVPYRTDSMERWQLPTLVSEPGTKTEVSS